MAAKETLISSFDIQENRASRSYALFLCATLVALFLLALPAISAAQTAGTGALSGTVTDQSGSSVGGAQVKVTSEASGEVRTVTTSPDRLLCRSLALARHVSRRSQSNRLPLR